jgi:hydrogenase maturation protein HypF
MTALRVGAPPATTGLGPMISMRQRRRILVSGVVQGVGFRPFVWSVATRLGLDGTVCNTSGAVVVEVEGSSDALSAFVRALTLDAPRLARVDAVDVEAVAVTDERGFRIVASRVVDGEYQPIAPDAATCAECLEDIVSPANRRYGYPFTNCTNCGPRFTIIEDVPYDRRSTTMRKFSMCSACRAEYDDPADRRFHAQPNGCWACGPRLQFAGSDGVEIEGDPIELAVQSLASGEIVALKGLGGFQLCCDALNEEAVHRLRVRKHRRAKPFAIMCSDLAAVRRLCDVSDAEASLLDGSVRPVVLMPLRGGTATDGVAPSVAPHLRELGVMLPSTPLHHLLLRAYPNPLVMTSGNLSEEPIATDNDEALQHLGDIADRFLLHDRDIHARYDDSVVRVVGNRVRMIRRARGFSPLPLPVASDADTVLALGGHLKNTFCILQDGRAFIGPHIGDLDDAGVLRHQDEALRAYLHLFRSRPAIVAADLHPDYASTRVAENWWDRGAREVRVQHHHAHIASVLAEHDIRGNVLGVAFDGVGLGPDQSIWGGEFLLCDERSYRRAGHIAAVPHPGGDACAREGWRMAISYLAAAGRLHETPPRWISESADAPTDRQWRLVSRVAASREARFGTSAGRLFDAVASLLGVAQVSTFEAEAAMRLEALAVSAGDAGKLDPIVTPFGGNPLVLDTVHLVTSLVRERERGRAVDELAAVFHESLARAIAAACAHLTSALGVSRVALSGGVFQNALLLSRLEHLLRDQGLQVYANEQVPSNDGGISLGQALVAASLETAA